MAAFQCALSCAGATVMTHGLFTSMSRRLQRLQCSAGQPLLRRKLSGRVRQNCLGLPAPLTAVLQSRHTAVGTFAGPMADDEDYRQRQEDEVRAIGSIFLDAGEFQDLRLREDVSGDSARPPELALRLRSPHGMLELHIAMSARYPDSPPELELRGGGLTDGELARLEGELRREARSRRGSEMVLDLANRCRELLESPAPSQCAPTADQRTCSTHGHSGAERDSCQSELTTTSRYSSKTPLASALDVVSESTYTSEEIPSPIQTGSSSDVDFEPITHLYSNFTIIQHLGSGGFGSVLKVQNKLDDKIYAVKKVILDEYESKEYNDIVQEAKCLAKLDHKHIVRYYTSWIDCGNIEDEDDSSEEEEDTSENEEGSDSIVFERSPEKSSSRNATVNSSPCTRICLCIQMECCENSTLKTALPVLPEEPQRLWRLFREIVEGLEYVHERDLIHRDLNPNNIFLDWNDSVKIADFGLATFKISQNGRTVKDGITATDKVSSASCSAQLEASEEGITCPKFPVGTVLYCAPEFTPDPTEDDTQERRVYTYKADIYSLGVILFEMCCGAFETGSERIGRLRDLREGEIDADIRWRLTGQQLELILWLLHHEPARRPSCREVLASELVPPPPLAEASLHTMVAACFTLRPEGPAPQRTAVRLEDTGAAVTREAVLQSAVRQRLERVFRRHGLVPLRAPLLSEPDAGQTAADGGVRLLTRSGALVQLPGSQLVPLTWLLAGRRVDTLRYFSWGAGYEERRACGVAPPRERRQLLLGWHAQPDAAPLADAQLLALLCELVAEFPTLASCDRYLMLGHAQLLEAALAAARVPDSCREAVLELIHRLAGRTGQRQLQEDLGSLGLSDKCVNMLLFLLELRGSLEVVRKQFTKRKSSKAASHALDHLSTVIQLARELGVKCEMVVHVGLSLGYQQQQQSDGLLFQLLVRPQRHALQVLAEGGRHDRLLARCWDQRTPPPAAGAALLTLPALEGAAAREEGRCSLVPVVVVAGGGHGLTAQATILRRLREAGIASLTRGGDDTEAAARWAADVGAEVLIVPEDGAASRVRARPLHARRSSDRVVAVGELVGHLTSLGVSGRRDGRTHPAQTGRKRGVSSHQ